MRYQLLWDCHKIIKEFGLGKKTLKLKGDDTHARVIGNPTVVVWKTSGMYTF
jgi:hypothetical protein